MPLILLSDMGLQQCRYVPGVKHRQGLEKCGLNADELRGIYRGNVAKLLPAYV